MTLVLFISFVNIIDIPDSTKLNGFDIIASETGILYEGDSLKLSCRSQKYDYRLLTWHKILPDNSSVQLGNRYEFVRTDNCRIEFNNSSPYSDHLNLIFDSLSLVKDKGLYRCSARLEDEKFPTERFFNISIMSMNYFFFRYCPRQLIISLDLLLVIIVSAVSKPEFLNHENHPSKLTANYSMQFALECRPSGSPDPIVTWYKDGLEIPHSRTGIDIVDSGR